MSVALQRRGLLLWLAASSVSSTGSASSASAQPGSQQPQTLQPWPARPLRLVVPNVVGGATDVAARLLASELQRSLAQHELGRDTCCQAGFLRMGAQAGLEILNMGGF